MVWGGGNQYLSVLGKLWCQRASFQRYSYNSNNNNNIYLLQLVCYPVAVVILHVYKT